MEEFRIYKYGEDILKQEAKDIQNINQQIVDLSNSMRQAMYDFRGIGLAAPQIGKSIKLATIDLSSGEDEKEFFVLINPYIIEAEGRDEMEEGCLSLPHISLNIQRNTKILLKAVTLDGKEFEREYEGFVARVIQHEIDHLNGKLIIDRVSNLKRQLAKREIKKLKQNGEW